MNNRGFTLVELLAVIAILIIIVGIAVPTISSSIERTNEKQQEVKRELIITTAELYLSDHKRIREKFYNAECIINVDSLIDNEYLKEEDITQNGEWVGNYIYYDNEESKIKVVDTIGTNVSEC